MNEVAGPRNAICRALRKTGLCQKTKYDLRPGVRIALVIQELVNQDMEREARPLPKQK